MFVPGHGFTKRIREVKPGATISQDYVPVVTEPGALVRTFVTSSRTNGCLPAPRLDAASLRREDLIAGCTDTERRQYTRECRLPPA